LVVQENQIEDVRFLFSPLTTPPLWPPKREYSAVSAERLIKFGNIVQVETSRHLTKITALWRKADCEVLVAKHTASLQLLCTVGGNQARLDARTEFKNLERSPKRGGEAGRAHHCRVACWYHSLVDYVNCGYTIGIFWCVLAVH
jgi:hypothetical protein